MSTLCEEAPFHAGGSGRGGEVGCGMGPAQLPLPCTRLHSKAPPRTLNLNPALPSVINVYFSK